MGKDSLIKSTAKKSGTKKGKVSKKKSTQPPATGAQNTNTTQPQAKAAKNAKKQAAPKTTVKDLLFRQFSTPAPTMQSKPAAPDFSRMTNPPLIDSDDPAEVERLRRLLDQKFSMAEIIAAAKAPVESTAKAAPPSAVEKIVEKPAPKMTVKDLLFKQFSAPAPTMQSEPAAPDFSGMTNPPLIDSDDPAEVERLRRLLDQKFSMAEIIAAAKAPVESTAKAPSGAQKEASAEIDVPAPEPRETPAALEDRSPAPEAEQIAPAPPIAASPENPPPEVEPATVSPPASETEQIAPAPPVEKSPESPQAEAASPPPDAEPPHRPSSGSDGTPGDPVMRAAKMGIAVVAILFFLILWASVSNSFKYFVVPKNGSVEVWRGDFSPSGKQFVVVLHGVQLDAPVQDEYRRQDVYPMIFTYYLEKADALLDVTNLPDYKAISDFLQRAQKFAITEQMRSEVIVRRNNIQFLSLLYKADVEAGKSTDESLQSALLSLKQARRLTSDPSRLELIDQKTAWILDRQSAQKVKADTSTKPEASRQ